MLLVEYLHEEINMTNRFVDPASTFHLFGVKRPRSLDGVSEISFVVLEDTRGLCQGGWLTSKRRSGAGTTEPYIWVNINANFYGEIIGLCFMLA